MASAEFFNPGDEQTIALNEQGDAVFEHNSLTGRDGMEIRAAEYMRAIIDTDNLQALKYAFQSSMSEYHGHEPADSSRNVHTAVKRLAAENPEYSDKFGGMLARLLEPAQLPPIDPRVTDETWQPTQQVDYRYYMTMLLHVTAAHPKSSVIFEAAHALVTSGDPRIHGRDVYQAHRFTDRLLENILSTHQTDRRMESTWQAALVQEESGDELSLYPDVMDLYPNQAFRALDDMYKNEGNRVMPLSVLLTSLESVLKGLRKSEEKTGRKVEDYFKLNISQVFYGLEDPARSEALDAISERFAHEDIVLKALQKENAKSR